MSIVVADILDQAGNQLGGFLPRFLGAILLLVIGVFVAWLLSKLLRKALGAAGVDETAERWGLHDAMERVGLPRSLCRVLGAVVRIGLTLVVIFASLSLLGLQFLSESLNAGVLLLPKLLVAAALLLAGIVLSGFARERVDHLTDQMDMPVPLGVFAQVTVLAVFAITAAAQIAVSSAILLVLVAIVLAAALGSIGLAFGLGGREIAGAVNAGRIVSGAFQIGQRIEVAGVAGEITEFDSVATLIRTDAGSTIRIPNRLLIAEPVTIRGDQSDPPATAP